MSNQKFLHKDCANYAPIDVRKGLCHLHKKEVPADGEMCPKFERMPKCRYCKNFTADKNKIELGVCEVSMNKPKFVAYPDMVAVTCKMYEEA